MRWDQWEISSTLPQSSAQNYLPVATANSKSWLNVRYWELITSRIASPFLRQSSPVFNLLLISFGFAPLAGPACNILKWCRLQMITPSCNRSSVHQTWVCWPIDHVDCSWPKSWSSACFEASFWPASPVSKHDIGQVELVEHPPTHPALPRHDHVQHCKHLKTIKWKDCAGISKGNAWLRPTLRAPGTLYFEFQKWL